MNNNNGNGNDKSITPYVVNSPIARGGLNNRGPVPARGLIYEADRNPPGNALALRGNLTTEALLGEGCFDSHHYVCDKSRLIPGYISGPDIYARSIDYPTVGPIGQVRAAVETMFARSRQMSNNFPLTVTGTTYGGTFANNAAPAPVTTQFPFSLGFVLDWGISMLAFAPFDMQITTTGWVGEDLQPLDRTMTLRVSRPAGSSIYIPWAQRITPSMSMAQAQLARPVGNGETAATIAVGPLPAAISASFSASVSFMTAFVPTTAAFAAKIGLYGNILGDYEIDPNTGAPVYNDVYGGTGE